MESRVIGVKWEEGETPKENQHSVSKEGKTLLGRQNQQVSTSPHTLNRKQIVYLTQWCHVTKPYKELSTLNSMCLSPHSGVLQHASHFTSFSKYNWATVDIFSIFLLKDHVDLSAAWRRRTPAYSSSYLAVPFYHLRKGDLCLQKKSVPLE